MVFNFGFTLYPVELGTAVTSIHPFTENEVKGVEDELPTFPHRILSESTPERWQCLFRLILQSHPDHIIAFEIVAVPEGMHMVQFRRYDVGSTYLVPKDYILFSMHEFAALLSSTNCFKDTSSAQYTRLDYEFGMRKKGDITFLYIKPSGSTDANLKIFVLPAGLIEKLQKPDLTAFWEIIKYGSFSFLNSNEGKILAERCLTWTALYYVCKELEFSMGIRSIRDGGLVPVSELQKITGRAMNKIEFLKGDLQRIATTLIGSKVEIMDDTHYVTDVIDILANGSIQDYDPRVGQFVFMMLESFNQYGIPRITAKCGYPI